MSWSISDFELVGNWYLGPIIPWQTELYGSERRSGVDDLFYNNCRLMIETGDRSHEAMFRHARCNLLLEQGKRWPDHMNTRNQCKTVFCSWVQKMKFKYYKKRGKAVQVKRRSQNDLTRDCFVLYHAAGVHLGWDVKAVYVKPPLRLWRPNFGAWMRAIRNPTKVNLWLWEMSEAFTALFSKEKEFTNVLYHYRQYTINQLAR